MKKLAGFLAALCLVCTSAYAADITFTPEGGGKWIFCNNPEAIHNEDLMNSGEDESSYIMNNENLPPDTYDFLICHINHTDTNDGYGPGYNIEVDMELTAQEDSVFTVNKAFFEVPQDEAFIFSDGTWAKEMHKVGCLNGLVSMIGIPACELNGSWLYKPEEYEPVTVELKKGDTVWLSSYIDSYSAVGFRKPMQILGEIVLESGKMDMNVAAFKSDGEIGDRSGFDPKAKYGKYKYTRTQKGVADSLPRVSAQLEYEITNYMQDGEYLPNKVYNQYAPDGQVTNFWCSHLNPQDDMWSQTIAVESDLLPMTYKDDEKLTYYGSRTRRQDRDNLWLWDTFHSDTADYPGKATWFNKDEYIPNYALSGKRENIGYAVSMGNYCVIESYEITAKNKTKKDKYFEYDAQTQSNILVYTEDESGKHSGLFKGEQVPATNDTMASVKIPAESEKTFSINVVLPINYVGGIRSSFRVWNESHIEKRYEDYIKEPRAAKGPIIRGIRAEEVKDKLPQEVRDIIGTNYDCYELVEGDDGYILRWCLWDSCPYYYTSDWVKVQALYNLDKNYNLTGKYSFDKLICFALYYDGYYYVQDADGNRFRSADGQSWEEYTHRLPIPDITFTKNQPSLWAQPEVERAYAIDLAPYNLKDKLKYDEQMTRAVFCEVLASMLELKDRLPDKPDTEVFTDTKSSSVQRLWSAGIISGYEDGSFAPNASITREEAAMVLSNAADYLQYQYPQADTQNRYADDSDIGQWARGAVYRMNDAGVMSGVGDNKFAPKSAYTCEQSIATILRLYDASESVE